MKPTPFNALWQENRRHWSRPELRTTTCSMGSRTLRVFEIMVVRNRRNRLAFGIPGAVFAVRAEGWLVVGAYRKTQNNDNMENDCENT